MPIAVSLFYLNDPVKFPCGRKPEYPKKTHNCRQSVDFTWELGSSNINVTLVRIKSATIDIKGEWFNHFITEAPLIM